MPRTHLLLQPQTKRQPENLQQKPLVLSLRASLVSLPRDLWSEIWEPWKEMEARAILCLRLCGLCCALAPSLLQAQGEEPRGRASAAQ